MERNSPRRSRRFGNHQILVPPVHPCLAFGVKLAKAAAAPPAAIVTVDFRPPMEHPPAQRVSDSLPVGNAGADFCRTLTLNVVHISIPAHS